jgi:gliding motility-associated transport system ATP-binding protein
LKQGLYDGGKCGLVRGLQVIEVRNLTKVYGQTLAVDNVSFTVPKGEIVGFLGPNGAGKSTTLKMLTCYLPPTSGGATVNGFDIFHQSEQVRASLGYLAENVPLYGEMKVRDYLDFRGRLRKMERAHRRARIDYVVERCWLTAMQHKSIGHLSKGYRQRVGLADALLHDPPVLILDEPTVGLDPSQIRETRKLIRDLGGQHTVILSTHILPEVEATCDRALVIALGRIVAQGSPDELRASRRLNSRLLVEMRAPRDQVSAVFSALPGVAGVEILNGQTDGIVTVALQTSEGRDVREAAAKTVLDHGWGLREIRMERASLEEFFVQVTADQAAGRSE